MNYPPDVLLNLVVSIEDQFEHQFQQLEKLTVCSMCKPQGSGSINSIGSLPLSSPFQCMWVTPSHSTSSEALSDNVCTDELPRTFLFL